MKIKKAEPTFYHILRKSAILLLLIGALFFLVLFSIGTDRIKSSDITIYVLLLLTFLLSFFTVYLVIRQALNQSNTQLLIEKEKLKIVNEFRESLSILPALLYRIKKNADGEMVVVYHEGKRAEEIGLTTENVKGMPIKEFLHKDIYETTILPFERAFTGNVVEFRVKTDTHIYEHTVTPIFDPATKEVIEISGYGVDITAHELANKKMKDLTEYDQLTGLYNRDKYAQVVERFIQEENENKQITILLIDLDDFKHINDTLGHSTGDQLLINVSNKLRELFLPDHDLFRLGGDEFVVLITHAITRDETINICQNIIQIIKEPISIGDHQLYTSASIGIAFYPEHATDSKFLLKQADLAMYRAKNEGKNNYFIYSKEMMDETIERIEMQKSLRHAVENQEFTLYYQPQIDVLTNDVVGVEALLRWYHPTKGFVSPLEFIPIAEETGMIQEIGEWVLRKACEQFSRWKVEGYEVPISVNLSAKQFKQVNLSVMIQDIIEETNMDPTCLTIEITESTSMEDVQFTISLLEELQNKGIEISIDDFGTGYSSLSYLQKLPINCLKIDRSFIQGIESRTNGIALVKTIIDLAENLNFSVIAEGVETIEQRDILSNLGCHKIQGFVYSKPITAEEIMSLMNNKIAI
ncbi:EAL domain-containing protein [Bacillus suaedaesalsae]|uniref:EAL domain-containing protein n=1 Tax=Bacillus suaedaesalsae TaxID=2810349 RepID=A0ABS2DI19_9BACI|nr:EAL domain-containing protein [Bacillus suaedaesalsae]